MGARRGAGAPVAAAVLTSLLLLAGPAHADLASQAYGLAAGAHAAQADPCAIPPGGQAPLMCQSGVVVPEEGEPATAPVSEPAATSDRDDSAGLLGALGAAAVAVSAGALVLLRRRRPTAFE